MPEPPAAPATAREKSGRRANPRIAARGRGPRCSLRCPGRVDPLRSKWATDDRPRTWRAARPGSMRRPVSPAGRRSPMRAPFRIARQQPLTVWPMASIRMANVSPTPSSHRRLRIGRIAKRREPGAQRQQMAREVAAVHRRDIQRQREAIAFACRTSCRSARDTAPAIPCCATHSSCGRPAARSTDSRNHVRPNWQATPRPMLVGEVRCATVTAGCSCTLSGGSQWSSGPT